MANGDLSVLLFRFGLFRFGSTKLYLVFFTEFSCSRTLVGSTWPCRYLVVPSFTEFWGFFLANGGLSLLLFRFGVFVSRFG